MCSGRIPGFPIRRGHLIPAAVGLDDALNEGAALQAASTLYLAPGPERSRRVPLPVAGKSVQLAG